MSMMKANHFRRTGRLLLAGFAICAATEFAAAAYDDREDDEKVEKDDKVAPPEGLLPERNQMQDEMAKLFYRVERNLEKIDVMLNDAGAGDVVLEEVEASGLDELLRTTDAKSSEVIADIDRIIEIAQSMGGGSCSSCMKPGDGSPQESPLDQPRDQGEKNREKTPDKPGGEEDQPKPKDGDKPDSPGKTDDPGRTRPGDPPDPERGDAVPVADDAEEWGMLPTRVREIFRQEGGDDLPVQYRDWIDAYYRRLNKER